MCAFSPAATRPAAGAACTTPGRVSWLRSIAKSNATLPAGVRWGVLAQLQALGKVVSSWLLACTQATTRKLPMHACGLHACVCMHTRVCDVQVPLHRPVVGRQPQVKELRLDAKADAAGLAGKRQLGAGLNSHVRQRAVRTLGAVCLFADMRM